MTLESTLFWTKNERVAIRVKNHEELLEDLAKARLAVLSTEPFSKDYFDEWFLWGLIAKELEERFDDRRREDWDGWRGS